MSYTAESSQFGDDLEDDVEERRSRWPFILGGCGCFTIVGFVLLIYAFFFLLQLDSDEIAFRLRDHPQIQTHLGEIEELKVNMIKTGNVDDDDVYVYDVTGSKASGELHISSTFDDNFDEEFHEIKLRLEGGEWIDIDLDQLDE
ncbi:MAG: hypothetical protein AAF497_26675, partial [Planctomycetota bacterium]